MSKAIETILGFGIWIVIGYGIYNLFSFDPVEYVKRTTPIEAMFQSAEAERMMNKNGLDRDDMIDSYKEKFILRGHNPKILEQSLNDILEDSANITSYSWASLDLNQTFLDYKVVNVILKIRNSKGEERTITFLVADSLMLKWFGYSLLSTPNEIKYLL